MMLDDASAILAHLQAVATLREAQAADSSLAARMAEIKCFQHRRFERSYGDLLQEPRQAAAARFFLDELYGPHDFSERDAQFARIVPALVRLFPREIVSTVRTLAELHALSERLDVAMAHRLERLPVSAAEYGRIWRDTGERDARHQQIELMMSVGQSLVRYTRNRFLRHTLRMMRGAARAAGLATLQQFLERGFDTFGRLERPEQFLGVIAERERQIADWLFDASGENSMPPGFE